MKMQSLKRLYYAFSDFGYGYPSYYHGYNKYYAGYYRPGE